MVLPFHYSDPGKIGNAYEAGAFSFFISNDLDWGQGSYCQRHAYFIFHRDPLPMKYLAGTYDPTLIAAEIRGWRATNAVGGTLTKTAAGYTGNLVIYDKTGAVCFSKSYDKPRAYFDMLGDMDADAIGYFGQASSTSSRANSFPESPSPLELSRSHWGCSHSCEGVRHAEQTHY
ncbi:MAG TPA: hypothetical protein VMD30_03585 [Tepidisphaeraceae bacterium]|nr:hypothetical protein [Tepidisphaeraceae bacterium]